MEDEGGVGVTMKKKAKRKSKSKATAKPNAKATSMALALDETAADDAAAYEVNMGKWARMALTGHQIGYAWMTVYPGRSPRVSRGH